MVGRQYYMSWPVAVVLQSEAFSGILFGGGSVSRNKMLHGYFSSLLSLKRAVLISCSCVLMRSAKPASFVVLPVLEEASMFCARVIFEGTTTSTPTRRRSLSLRWRNPASYSRLMRPMSTSGERVEC